MPAVIIYAIQALQIATALAAAGKDVVTLLKQIRDALTTMQSEKRDPSAEEWSALNAHVMALLAEINAPRA